MKRSDSSTLKNTKLKNKTTRTRHISVTLTDAQLKKFAHAQVCYCHLYNLGLNFLDHEYGYSRIKRHLKTNGMVSKYIIKQMTDYAINQMLKKQPDVTKRKLKYYFDIQSIHKMFEGMLVNYHNYKHAQAKLEHSEDGRKKYEAKKNCNYINYGHPKYCHDEAHFNTIFFKSNGGQSVKRLNAHTMKIPYFGEITLKEPNLKFGNVERIQDIKLKQYKNSKFELQFTLEKQLNRKTIPKQVKAVALDWNMHLNRLLVANDHTFYGLSNELSNEMVTIDHKLRVLDNLLNEHKKDNSNLTKLWSLQRQNLFTKQTNIMKEWLIKTIKDIASRYDVICIEQLASFTMRNKKRKKYRKNDPLKDRITYNHNHELSKLMPGIFKKVCESIVPDQGKVLIEVDSYLTSKVCHACGYINNNLQLGQEHWQCSNKKCYYYKHIHDRDINAAINILVWALNPEKHIKWQLHLQNNDEFNYLKKEDELVTVF